MDSDEMTTQKGVTYCYESLLAEHFQHLAQAILLREYPGLQCLPVGMPDGGRDAFVVDNAHKAVVFQVKFARNPSKIDDLFKWVTSALDDEIPKISELEKRGAVRYILVTNVPGTAHLDVGLIDRVNDYLQQNVKIPSQCLWRDDLDRRLDNAYDIKMRFPHLLNGPDLIRLIWESSANDALRRRRETLEAYLRDQYRTDETLRFKQVEMLTTRLFDLFVDVPISPNLVEENPRVRNISDKTTLSREILHRIAMPSRDHRRPREFEARPGLSVGAAQLFSDPVQMRCIRRLVVEGAPGQGKTTLTQYLAQVQRARYLDKQELLERLPAEHTRGPTFLPLKIELRDLSHWLNGRDPWSSDLNARHDDIPSLESALAAHIRRYSGGATFDVDDLKAVLRTTPTLLILDALDEVADLDDRKSVVNEIESAAERLDTTPGNLVVLVTSRPTAISNAPKIDRSNFVYYSLRAITPSLALRYADSWSKARGIPRRDADELQEILEGKLESTHMAELAKNTMQLTILLSLVLARGTSLPDKRTELYTSYLDLFLSRESDKSTEVRNNRALILDLHGYLAYYLHAKAEGQRTTGRIGASELREQVADYLNSEGHPPGLAEVLFHAVVQRVVALVSRIEGTFEFEVQPLREYFAARHLYHTAPYSPPGQERKGTKPDRFDGLAPNPYWMNVTRFYAGFFSKGELMDLAHRVCHLMSCTEDKLDFYPRRLALALLQDWVFSQVPPAVKMVVETLLDDNGLTWAPAMRRSAFTRGDMDEFRLWPGGGGAEYAAEIIWNQIVLDTADDWCRIWCSLISSVESVDATHIRWSAHLKKLKSARSRSRWAQVAEFLGIVNILSATEYSNLLDADREKYLPIRAFSLRDNFGHFQYLSSEHQGKYICSVLNLGSDRPLDDYLDMDNSLRAFLALSHPLSWRSANVRRRFSRISDGKSPGDGPFDVMNKLLWQQLNDPRIDESLGPWEVVVNSLESTYGRSLTTVEISCAAAAIVSKTERGQGALNLVDMDSEPLPRRYRRARWSATRIEWWAAQFDRIHCGHDALIWLVGLWSWGSTECVSRLLPLVERALDVLDEDRRENLVCSLQMIAPRNKKFEISKERIDESTRLDSLSPPALLLLASRGSTNLRCELVDRYLVPLLPRRSVARCVFPVTMDRLVDPGAAIEALLGVLRECTTGLLGTGLVDSIVFKAFEGSKMRRSLALSIVNEGMNLPPLLVRMAQAYGSHRLRATRDSVLKIAKVEGWFEG